MNKYIKRFFTEPGKSFFLFGPRGTGKSTMVSSRHPDALVLDLRIPQTRYRLSANPDYLLSLVRAQPEGKTIIIDEIQYVPSLLPLIHLLIEEKRKWKFILTGSSPRKLKRQSTDLLGGRALRKVLHPFMAAELQDSFVLEDALKYGLLPLRFEEENPRETLQAYVSLYIEEEVKAEGLIRKIEPFARFLQVLSFSHGSIVNVTNISRECHVQRTTVSNWISGLEDLLLCFELPVFTYRAKREVTVHPKIYLFDAGVYQALRPSSLNDSQVEINGASLEGLVAQHLVAWRDYSTDDHTLHYWRTRSGVEVDFIILGPTGLWAIEVKNSSSLRPRDLKPLMSFGDEYPEAKKLLLYRGKDRLLQNGILCLPVDDFLKNLRPDSPIAD